VGNTIRLKEKETSNRQWIFIPKHDVFEQGLKVDVFIFGVTTQLLKIDMFLAFLHVRHHSHQEFYLLSNS
jgi:hypothetical protein